MKYGYLVVMAVLFALYLFLEEPPSNKPKISAMDFENDYTAVRVSFVKPKYDVTFIVRQNEDLVIVCDESAASRTEVTIAHDRSRRTNQLHIWPLNKRIFLNEQELPFFSTGSFEVKKNLLTPKEVPLYVQDNLKDELYYQNESRLVIHHTN